MLRVIILLAMLAVGGSLAFSHGADPEVEALRIEVEALRSEAEQLRNEVNAMRVEQDLMRSNINRALNQIRMSIPSTPSW